MSIVESDKLINRIRNIICLLFNDIWSTLEKLSKVFV